MTSFDLDLLNLNLLPVTEGTLNSPTVETNFRELSEAVRVMKAVLLELRELFAVPAPEFGVALEIGRYTETFTATSSKTVLHNIGISHPQVSVYRSSGRLIHTLVTNVDTNTVRLDFTGTLTGAVVAVDFAQT